VGKPKKNLKNPARNRGRIPLDLVIFPTTDKTFKGVEGPSSERMGHRGSAFFQEGFRSPGKGGLGETDKGRDRGRFCCSSLTLRNAVLKKRLCADREKRKGFHCVSEVKMILGRPRSRPFRGAGLRHT